MLNEVSRGYRYGIRFGRLGTESDLSIAFPLANGDLDEAAHTDADRIGFFAHRGSGGGFGVGLSSAGFVGVVIYGTRVLEIGDDKVATNGDLTCGDDIIALDEVRARSGGSSTDPKFAFHDNDGTYDPLTLQVGWWYDDVSNFIGTTVGGTHIVSTFADRVEVEATTGSTSSTTGALVVGGGLGVAMDINVGGDLDIDGTAIVRGVLEAEGGFGATMDSHNRGWISYSSANAAIWGADSATVTVTGATSGATATVIGTSGVSTGYLDLYNVSATDFVDGETLNISGGSKDGTTAVADTFHRQVRLVHHYIDTSRSRDVIAFGSIPNLEEVTADGWGNYVFFCGQNSDFDIISTSFNADLVIEKEYRGRRKVANQIRLGWEGLFGQLHSHDTIRLSFDPNGSTEFPLEVEFTDATAATSSTTGAVTIPNGGLGVGGDVHAGGNFEAGNRVIAGGDVIAGDDVTLADELRLGPSDLLRASAFKVNAAISAFTGGSDTNGRDTYWRTQSGGAHSANNPRGGDIIVDFGSGGAGGTGRDGRMQINGEVLVGQPLTVGTGSLRFIGFTSSSAAPTTTEYPNDKDCGIHKNTSNGEVSFVYNDSGSIKTTTLS